MGSLIRVSAVCVFALLALSADKLRAQVEAPAATGGGGPVLVLRPPADDPERTDAFNRLWAELHIHGFEANALEREAGDAPATTLTALVQESAALAAFAIVRRDGSLSLEAVLADRTSRQTSPRRLAFPAGTDAASLIAVRAVDLLRASLQELPPPGRATEPEIRPIEPAALQREDIPPPTAAAPDVAQRDHAFTLAAEGTMIWTSSKFSVGFGPALGLLHRPLPWLRWGVWVGGVFGSSFDAATGSATMQQELGFLEARASFVRTSGFELAALAGGGVFFLQAKGEPRAPRMPAQDSVWSGLATIGLHAEQSLGGDFALGLSARAIGLAPSLGVAIASERAKVRLPALQASLGLSVGF